VKVVRFGSKAGVANVTAGSGKRAAIAAGTIGVGSGVKTTGGDGRTGDAIAGAGKTRSAPARTGGALAGAGAGRGAGDSTTTGAGLERCGKAQAPSSAAASTASKGPGMSDLSHPVIRFSSAPTGTDAANIAAASTPTRDQLC
jgi:hypothetical protein